MDTEPNTEGLVGTPPAHVQEQLSAFLDNQLAEEQRLIVETHLQECEECRTQFQNLASSRAELQPPPEMAPSPEFPDPVTPAPGLDLGDFGGSPGSSSSGGRTKWALVVIASSAVVAAGVYFLVGRGGLSNGLHRPAANQPPSFPPPSAMKGNPPASSKESLVKTLSDQFGKPPAVTEVTPSINPKKETPAASAPKKMPVIPEPVIVQKPVVHTPAPPKAAPSAPAVVKPVVAQKPVAPAAAPKKLVPSVPASPKPAQKPVVAKKPAPKAAAGENAEIHYPATPKVHSSENITAAPEAEEHPVVIPAPAKLSSDPVATATSAKDGSPEWKGDSSGIREPLLIVVHDLQEWEYLWRAHYRIVGTPTALPPVDFNRYVVVGVYAGEKRSSGYSIEITGTELTPTSLIVDYKETEPPAGGAQTKSTTQPYHLKAIPKTPLVIQFKKL